MVQQLICLTCGKRIDGDDSFDVHSDLCFSCGEVGRFTKRRRITSGSTSEVLEVLENGLSIVAKAACHKVYKHKLAEENKIAKAFRNTFRNLISNHEGAKGWNPPKYMRSQDNFLDGSRKEYNMPKRMTKKQIRGDSIGELFEDYFCHLVANHPRIVRVKTDQKAYLGNGELLVRGKPDFAYLYLGAEEQMTIPVELKTVKDEVFDHGKLRETYLGQVSRYASLGFRIGWSNRPICILILVARESGRCTTMVVDDRYFVKKEKQNDMVNNHGILNSRLQNHQSGKVAFSRAWNLLSKNGELEDEEEGQDILKVDRWVINAVQARLERVQKRLRKNKKNST